jgi:hypothetical protein
MTYIALVGLGVVAGAGTGFFAASSSPSGGQAVGQTITGALEAQSGQDLEVLQTEKEEGLFKVDVRTENDQVQTYYASPTGGIFFTQDSATRPETVEAVANQRRQLGDCLRNKQAVLYGNISQRATQAQIQVIGQGNLRGVYADVNNASVRRAAVQQGVQRTPALVYNGSALTGAETPQRIAEFTGCDFNVTG